MPKPKHKMTMADHARAWYRERGHRMPATSTKRGRKMYDSWQKMAFSHMRDGRTRRRR